MADVTSIEQDLHEASAHLGAVAGALTRVDVEQLERLAPELSDVALRLCSRAAAGVQGTGADLARALASVSWQLERCRRLGRAFEGVPDVVAPGYEPDGRSRQRPAPSPTIEVLG